MTHHWSVPACLCAAGLLQLMKSEDELAAVLAHECAHVLARHGAERMSQAQFMQVGGRHEALWVQGWLPLSVSGRESCLMQVPPCVGTASQGSLPWAPSRCDLPRCPALACRSPAC